jgi:hypothetical protein
VSPTFGTSTGQTRVTVTGTNFASLNSAFACRFGTIPGIAVTVVSSLQAICWAPSVANLMTVTLQVSNNAQEWVGAQTFQFEGTALTLPLVPPF